jgi:hypothetical protein
MNFNGLQVACSVHRSRQDIPAGQQGMDIETRNMVEHGNRNEVAAIRRAVGVDGDHGVAALRRCLDVLVDGGLRGMRGFDQAGEIQFVALAGVKILHLVRRRGENGEHEAVGARAAGEDVAVAAGGVEDIVARRRRR